MLRLNTEKEQNTSGEKPCLCRDASAYASVFRTRMDTLIHSYNYRIIFLKSIIVTVNQREYWLKTFPFLQTARKGLHFGGIQNYPALEEW